MKQLIVLFFILMNSACATMVLGKTQDFYINYPIGAKVYVNESYKGVSPVVVKVDRNYDNLYIRLEKECYYSNNAVIKSRMSAAIIGDVWPIIPVIVAVPLTVDLVTGSLWYYPDYIPIELERNEQCFDNKKQ